MLRTLPPLLTSYHTHITRSRHSIALNGSLVGYFKVVRLANVLDCFEFAALWLSFSHSLLRHFCLLWLCLFWSGDVGVITVICSG